MSQIPHFPAKLLLFGEYTVLIGGRALAIPVEQWSGHFKLHSGTPASQELMKWVNYLQDQCAWSEEQITQVRYDLKRGLYFESNIPEGYGLGSSGALCAAMYDRFCDGQEAERDIGLLRNRLALMESFYHGSSSGLDPLVSYLKRPILREGSQYTPTQLPVRTEWPHMFLIDSGKPRKTSELVQQFYTMLERRELTDRVMQTLIMDVEHCIQYFCDGHWPLMYEHLQLVSQAQYDLFVDFVPDSMRELWRRSMVSQDVFIKLCGAGGGGYFLGFARKKESVDVLGCEGDVIWV